MLLFHQLAIPLLYCHIDQTKLPEDQNRSAFSLFEFQCITDELVRSSIFRFYDNSFVFQWIITWCGANIWKIPYSSVSVVFKQINAAAV